MAHTFSDQQDEKVTDAKETAWWRTFRDDPLETLIRDAAYEKSRWANLAAI